jgi:hypothetical protein
MDEYALESYIKHFTRDFRWALPSHRVPGCTTMLAVEVLAGSLPGPMP